MASWRLTIRGTSVLHALGFKHCLSLLSLGGLCRDAYQNLNLGQNPVHSGLGQTDTLIFACSVGISMPSLRQGAYIHFHIFCQIGYLQGRKIEHPGVLCGIGHACSGACFYWVSPSLSTGSHHQLIWLCWTTFGEEICSLRFLWN